ncbi:ionotropic receptor 40a-like isoform X2 [Euwallacea similis]|uniref:ionotropic receptor 40a-like isoform X2 n=1 Tax=Euwallacea similis TaxID=1736056 RepID=UPI00344DC56A
MSVHINCFTFNFQFAIKMNGIYHGIFMLISPTLSTLKKIIVNLPITEVAMKLYLNHAIIIISYVVFSILLINSKTYCFKTSKLITYEDQLQRLRRRYGGDLVSATYEIVKSFPENKLIIGFDITDHHLVISLLPTLEKGKISVTLFNFSSLDALDKIYDRNYIRRTLIYIFHWKTNWNDPIKSKRQQNINACHWTNKLCYSVAQEKSKQAFSRHFLMNIHSAMRVIVIYNSRPDSFRIYYNQATSYKEHHLNMVNWWDHEKGLFHHPTLPQKKSVYKDFHGKLLRIPVLHKPPWHFVRYNLSDNKSFEVIGGRDDRILNLLSRKLNFRYVYSDPPERIQGSATSENGEFNGVLGLVSNRKADLFIGDMGIIWERINVVEFSFITLADSGAFVTHAPSKLNEALALLRPFQWQVWPAIGFTCLIVGPFLYILIALPNAWQPRFLVRSHTRLFFDCTWFTITILLKQTGKEPSNTQKTRFFIILLSMSSTYIITDMYSANLTSLLARPGREKAITNLYQLKNVMESTNFELFIEKHSPSFGLIENGSGIYGQIWDIMQRSQNKYVVESVEEGVKLVKDKRNVAVMAGRETLFFDTQRFGHKNFHLSEKLNTAYSAIALQLGCPYIEEINKILMANFEAGIITKMTENEYEKLGKQQNIPDAKLRENEATTASIETNKRAKATEDDKLKPISLKMLQGSFYLLFIGNIFSGLILLIEIGIYKYHLKARRRHKSQFQILRKLWRKFRWLVKTFRCKISRMYRNFMHDAITMTLEYTE